MCTVADSILRGTTNARLLRQLSSIAPEARIFVTAEVFAEARDLYRQGAAFVFIPGAMGVEKLRDMVLTALSGRWEEQHLAASADLESRSEVLP